MQPNLFVLFMFLSAHFIGDYVFQTPYLAEMKKHSFYHLFAHCFIYTWMFAFIGIIICAPLSICLLIGIFLSHIIMDSWKCKKGHNKRTYVIDQVYHIAIVLIVTYLHVN